ncbi:STAS domain-containing protein [Nonomuraea sp. NPDC049725]|uniref:STAS domain-containing protein n=1 Tax=Nonomuraea sp. NPDC049725 TaxID=3154508 RepID=UPI003433CA8B
MTVNGIGEPTRSGECVAVRSLVPPEQVLYVDHQLRITCTLTPESTVIRLAGEIDVTNRREAMSTLTQARRIDDQLIVDLGRVTFADISVVRALTAFAADGAAHIRNVPAQIARLLDLLNLPAFD